MKFSQQVSRSNWRVGAVAMALVMVGGMTLGLPRSAEARRRGNPKQTIKKMGAYIFGLNRLSKDVRRSYRFYTTNMQDKKAGPTCQERGISLGMVRAKRTCKGIKRASRKRPRLRVLEKAGKKYCRAARRLEKITGRLSSYYRTRAYRLDNCKKGRRAHRKLMQAFSAFFAADTVIRSEVDRIQKDVDVAMRRHLKRRYGRNMRFYHHVGPRVARRALRIAGGQMRARSPNTGSVLKAAGDIEQLVVKMDAVARKHGRKAARSGFRSYVTYMRLYSRELGRFAKKLQTGRARQVSYFWKKVINTFNRMINYANRVHFKKRMR